jgi:hypothetical protein
MNTNTNDGVARNQMIHEPGIRAHCTYLLYSSTSAQDLAATFEDVAEALPNDGRRHAVFRDAMAYIMCLYPSGRDRYAAFLGVSNDKLKVLLDNMLPVSMSAFMVAAAEHRLNPVPLLRYCIEKRGMSPNAVERESGKTALHAVMDLSAAKYLVQAGANVNARDLERRTPLHTVFKRSIIKYLLEAGANPLLKDASGKTPLVDVLDRVANRGPMAPYTPFDFRTKINSLVPVSFKKPSNIGNVNVNKLENEIRAKVVARKKLTSNQFVTSKVLFDKKGGLPPDVSNMLLKNIFGKKI